MSAPRRTDATPDATAWAPATSSPAGTGAPTADPIDPTAGAGAGSGFDRVAFLGRTSFSELGARGRARALLDPGSARELAGPFDGIESPWLEPQGLVPQSDDAMVVARGCIERRPVLVAAVEGAFLGGAVGEVGGAKLRTALQLADRDRLAAAVLVLDSGGVRLQESTLALQAVGEIAAEVVAIRRHLPVIAVIAGPVGCFGGLGVVAALCSSIIMTPGGRLGLNGPEAIEAEAGIAEVDSSDRALVWSLSGSAARRDQGLIDATVLDDVDHLRTAIVAAADAGPRRLHRSADLDALRARLHPPTPTPAEPTPTSASTCVSGPSSGPGAVPARAVAPGADPAPIAPGRDAGPAEAPSVDPPAAARSGSAGRSGPAGRSGSAGRSHPAGWSRGRAWLAALCGDDVRAVVPSVLVGDLVLGTETVTAVAIVPDPDSPHPRARHGEVGVREAQALAEVAAGLVDHEQLPRRGLVSVVDVPSQAYGRFEEIAGIHLALAAATDAAVTARLAGHPLVTLVVGSAISGGYLAHGAQANQLLALDDPDVRIGAMNPATASRITRRSARELATLGRSVAPLSYEVGRWHQLGLGDGLVPVVDADDPTAADVRAVRHELAQALGRARALPVTLDHRLDPARGPGRAASRRAAAAVRAQWDG